MTVVYTSILQTALHTHASNNKQSRIDIKCMDLAMFSINKNILFFFIIVVVRTIKMQMDYRMHLTIKQSLAHKHMHIQRQFDAHNFLH